MASTTLPPRSPAPGDRTAPPLVPGGGRQRRWSLALLAILMTLGSALAFVVLWMNAGGREPVLALRNNVAAGPDHPGRRPHGGAGVRRQRHRADLRRRPATRSIGQPAATNLLAGTLLVEEAVGTADDLDTGNAGHRHPGADRASSRPTTSRPATA